MSLSKKDDGRKWVQSSVAALCLILVYILISFFSQMGEWFALESKIPYFLMGSQILAVLIAFGVFVFINKHKETSTFLSDVYEEASKVVWPNRIETNKHTIVIMIGVTIVGFLLGIFDLVSTWLLSLIR